MPPEVGSSNRTACPAFTVAFPTVKLTEPILMVAAPPALDVAVGGATVAVAVAVAMAVAPEVVFVLPQAASASTSARPNIIKGIRIGDPSPHEWSGCIHNRKPQCGSPIDDRITSKLRHMVTHDGL